VDQVDQLLRLYWDPAQSAKHQDIKTFRLLFISEWPQLKPKLLNQLEIKQQFVRKNRNFVWCFEPFIPKVPVLFNLLLMWWVSFGFYAMSNVIGCSDLGGGGIRENKQTKKQTYKDRDHTTRNVNTKRTNIWIINAKKPWNNTTMFNHS